MKINAFKQNKKKESFQARSNDRNSESARNHPIGIWERNNICLI